jgi:hypothetical protein
MKSVGFAIVALVLFAGQSGAADYMSVRCSELNAHPGWSSHIVGWLNVQNRDGSSQLFDPGRAEIDERKLTQMCLAFPDLPLHLAAPITFPEIEHEDRG